MRWQQARESSRRTLPKIRCHTLVSSDALAYSQPKTAVQTGENNGTLKAQLLFSLIELVVVLVSF
jgi:hypothetical protein